MTYILSNVLLDIEIYIITAEINDLSYPKSKVRYRNLT